MQFNNKKKNSVSNIIPTILQNVKLGNNWLGFFIKIDSHNNSERMVKMSATVKIDTVQFYRT